MAKSPIDLIMLLQTMVGNGNVFNADDFFFLQQQQQQLNTTSKKTIRIGNLGDWGGQIPFEDGVLDHCRNILKMWSSHSSNVIKVENVDGSMTLFPFDEVWEAYNIVRFATTYEKYSTNLDVDTLLEKRGDLIREELAWEIEQGKLVTDGDLQRAKEVHERFVETWLQQVFDEFDAVVLPTAQVWPFPIEDRYPTHIQNKQMDTYHQWMQVCVPVSFGGLPCVTLPTGVHDVTGLPMGIQLFGKRGDDMKLLSLANGYHEVTEDFPSKVVFTDNDLENACLLVQ
jgi:amidase